MRNFGKRLLDLEIGFVASSEITARGTRRRSEDASCPATPRGHASSLCKSFRCIRMYHARARERDRERERERERKRERDGKGRHFIGNGEHPGSVPRARLRTAIIFSQSAVYRRLIHAGFAPNGLGRGAMRASCANDYRRCLTVRDSFKRDSWITCGLAAEEKNRQAARKRQNGIPPTSCAPSRHHGRFIPLMPLVLRPAFPLLFMNAPDVRRALRAPRFASGRCKGLRRLASKRRHGQRPDSLRVAPHDRTSSRKRRISRMNSAARCAVHACVEKVDTGIAGRERERERENAGHTTALDADLFGD